MNEKIKTWLPSLIIMCGCGPIFGTFFISSFWGQPELIISNDLAGVPVLFYAYITVLPVVIPASIFWCYLLSLKLKQESKQKADIERNKFFTYSLRLGIFFGFIFAIFPISSALFAGDIITAILWTSAGILTGAVCSLLCFPIWRRKLSE